MSRLDQWPYEEPKSGRPSSDTGGVPGFSIGGRMVEQRERMLGMSDEERRWRAQYLKDQLLAPDEPRYSHEYYVATNNIFRRLARVPLDFLMKPLLPILGQEKYKAARYMTGRALMGLFLVGVFAYNIKYKSQDWTRIGGPNIVKCPHAYLPGDPEYDNYQKPKPHEYYDLGFSQSVFCKNGQ